jgi:hypothetical protein
LAVLALAHAIGATVPQAGPRDRERAVLSVLAQLNASDEVWLEDTVFERERNELGRPHFVPNAFVGCALSAQYLDAPRAKQIARELCAVYGFDAEPDYLLRADGVEVLLDGYDAQRKVGFKLRGMLANDDPWGMRPGSEPPSTDLTRAELERLEAAGVRLDVADLDAYPGASVDACTPLFAYVTDLVAFLDEVTGGPQVDLRAVLGTGVQRLRITGVEGATEWREKIGYWRSLRVPSRRPVTLCIEWDGMQRVERRGDAPFVGWYRAEQPWPTRGAPSRLHVNLLRREHAGVAIRVAQAHPEGMLECRSPGTTLLLPSTFDVTRRFTVTLELNPGVYLCDPWVMVGCRAP